MPVEDTSPGIAKFTLDGVPDARLTRHPYTTDDGLALSLFRFTRDTGGDAVMVVPGLTTSTDMFVMPEHRNLVTCLLDDGYDVWCLDPRMSMRHDHNARAHTYTFDDCALHDFPPALKLIRDHIGDQRRLHVVAHCLGAMTFLMSLAAGRVGGFASAVLNSVALTPRVPLWSRAKLMAGPRLFPLAGIDVLDPTWSERTPSRTGRLVSRVVSLAHPECDVPACHLLSMMWGTGWPAMYSHPMIDDRTHRRAADLFGPTGLHFYRHMDQMVRARTAVKFRPHRTAHASLPDDYLAAANGTVDIPLLLTTGSANRVFTDSNVVLHDLLRRPNGRRHELCVFEGYGHQDVFMGRDVARDVFPQMLEFLSRAR